MFPSAKEKSFGPNVAWAHVLETSGRDLKKLKELKPKVRLRTGRRRTKWNYQIVSDIRRVGKIGANTRRNCVQLHNHLQMMIKQWEKGGVCAE